MIYMDNAATTVMKEEVLQAMLPYMTIQYANPGGIYRFAEDSRNAVDDARALLAATLQAKPEEIYFTSGGTEADNWALRGVLRANAERGNHIITTAMEHHGVLNSCAFLEKNGYDVTYIRPGADGIVSVEQIQRALRPSTVLVSVMAANNEVGTLQPIEKIAELAQENHILFHTDAVQAYGHIPISVKKIPIDLLSTSAHKFYGPKGIGFLYIRKGVKIEPLIFGGKQEGGLRPGTENVAGIVGMAKAAQLALADIEEKNRRESKLRNLLIHRVLTEMDGAQLSGDEEKRLPNNAHFCFSGIHGEALIRLLDKNEVAASTGAACAIGGEEVSHVLTAMGYSRERALGSLRLTISDTTTEEEIHRCCDVLKEEVARLRRMTS